MSKQGHAAHHDLPGRLHKKADKKLRARRSKKRSAWFGLSLFGLVGWSVSIPTLLGTALGIWLDERFEDPLDWTLALLLAGLTIGCLTAWFWMDQERRGDD